MNILLIAYKIEADKGSEDGTGYHLTKALLQKEKNITLVTRPNNIQKLRSDPAFKDVQMVEAEVPQWLGFFKRKEKGIILYYYLWQMCVGIKVWQLQKKKQFDVIHQLNFHATWAPHFLFSNSAAIIWGPITHHRPVPRQLWYGSPVEFYAKEKIKHIVKNIFWLLDPFLFWAVKRSKVILYSAQTLQWPYSFYKDKLRFMTYAGSAFLALIEHDKKRSFNILYVGRFIDLKGCVTALSAIRQFALRLSVEDRLRVTVTIVGQGEREEHVAALCQIIKSATGISVELLPWQEQSYLSEFYQNASVFLYPSFEGQGLVVAEALAHGCPVLCLEDTGPHRLAGIAAIAVRSDGSASDVTERLSGRLDKLFKEFQADPDLYAKRIEASFERAQQLEWSCTAEKILEAYRG